MKRAAALMLGLVLAVEPVWCSAGRFARARPDGARGRPEWRWPASGAAVRRHDGECVVLLHGLCRTARSMKLLEWRLRREGYRVINVSYASTRRTIQELANVWLAGLLERRLPDRAVKVHFVTHSLGGIIVRQYLHDHPAEARRVGRVVMLAPPNHGSELADLLQRNFLFKLWCGPVRRQLGTDAASVPRQLGPASCEVGVIAGDRCLNPLAALFLPRPNDGRVSVRSARLEGMADFLVTHHTHTCIMWNNDVADAVARFLETGHF